MGGWGGGGEEGGGWLENIIDGVTSGLRTQHKNSNTPKPPPPAVTGPKHKTKTHLLLSDQLSPELQLTAHFLCANVLDSII